MGTEILKGVVGSKAYGLATESSDTDRLAVHLAPSHAVLGLGVREAVSQTIHTTSPDFTSHELGKFCELALKANPTLLELLWLDDYETHIPAGELLVANRSAFLSSRCVRAAYGGYALSEAKRILRTHELESHRPNLEREKKRGRHALRVALQGLHLLQTGELLVNVSANTAAIVAAGELAARHPETLLAIIEKHVAAIDETETTLPSQPDRELVDSLVQEIRAQQIHTELFVVDTEN